LSDTVALRRALGIIALVVLIAAAGWLLYATLKPMGKDDLGRLDDV
jgi:hypothetical protein